MKKILLPGSGRIGLCIFALLFCNACLKTDLHYNDPRNGNTDFKQCVITQIDDGPSVDGSLSRQLNITYNSRRDPIVAEPLWVGTGSPRWLFYYDKKGRLTSYAGVYNNGFFEFWHNYHYDNRDRIISDTIYIFGIIGQEGSTPYWRHAQLYYDNLNRIVRQDLTSAYPWAEPPFTGTFTYNAAGNLDGDSWPYDNKVNPLLTNKIWRFLARDYSVNNMQKADSYNDKGLPLHFSSRPYFYSNFWGLYGGEANIQYDCQGDQHSGW